MYCWHIGGCFIICGLHKYVHQLCADVCADTVNCRELWSEHWQGALRNNSSLQFVFVRQESPASFLLSNISSTSTDPSVGEMLKNWGGSLQVCTCSIITTLSRMCCYSASNEFKHWWCADRFSQDRRTCIEKSSRSVSSIVAFKFNKVLHVNDMTEWAPGNSVTFINFNYMNFQYLKKLTNASHFQVLKYWHFRLEASLTHRWPGNETQQTTVFLQNLILHNQLKRNIHQLPKPSIPWRGPGSVDNIQTNSHEQGRQHLHLTIVFLLYLQMRWHIQFWFPSVQLWTEWKTGRISPEALQKWKTNVCYQH